MPDTSPMERFTLAHTTGVDTETLIADCARQLGPLPESASLGFLYLTDALAPRLDELVDGLREATGVPHWVGTVGLAVCATGHEYYDSPALVALVGDFPPGSFRMMPLIDGNPAPYVGLHRDWLTRDETLVALVHGDPTNPRTPPTLNALAEALPNLFMFGGITSSQGEHRQIADLVVRGGLSGVIFGPEVGLVTAHTQGCTPIGPRHRITRGDRNLVLELDQRPALDVMKTDIGEVLARDLNRIGGYIFAGLPVPGSDDDDYLIRNIVGIDQGRKIVAIGDYAEEDGELMFCRRDGNTARIDLLRMLGDLQGRMNGTPRGAVYISCVGRGRYQFGEDSAELKIIQDALGDVPLVGFFANGEIFRNRLYGFTGVLTLFL